MAWGLRHNRLAHARTRERHGFEGERPAVGGLPAGAPPAAVGAYFSRVPASLSFLGQARVTAADRHFLLQTPVPPATPPAFLGVLNAALHSFLAERAGEKCEKTRIFSPS